MVEWRLIHSVTIEMCTGFLILASIGILVKFLADGYLKRFFGKIKPFDKLATVTSRYAEPASYFALGAGIFMTFVSMGTGSLSWTIDRLLNSPLAHNKVLLTITSQTLYIGIFLLRTRYTYAIWLSRSTAWVYTLLTQCAFAFLILQNSVAGQMVGKGSIIDDLLHWFNIEERLLWTFPQWASIVLIIAAIVTIVIAIIILRKQKSGIEQKPAAAS